MLCCRHVHATSVATHQVSLVAFDSSTLWSFALFHVNEQKSCLSVLAGHLMSAQSFLLLKESYLHASQDQRLDNSLARGDINSPVGMIFHDAMRWFSEIECAELNPVYKCCRKSPSLVSYPESTSVSSSMTFGRSRKPGS